MTVVSPCEYPKVALLDDVIKYDKNVMVLNFITSSTNLAYWKNGTLYPKVRPRTL